MAQNDIIKDVIPSTQTMKSLAFTSLKVTAGGIAGALAGNLASMVPMPFNVPILSKRTVGSFISMGGLYFGYKKVKNPMLKDTLKFAVAGNIAYLGGSVIYDLLGYFNVQLPTFGNFILSSATGVSPIAVQKADTEVGAQEVDLDSAFA